MQTGEQRVLTADPYNTLYRKLYLGYLETNLGNKNFSPSFYYILGVSFTLKLDLYSFCQSLRPTLQTVIIFY